MDNRAGTIKHNIGVNPLHRQHAGSNQTGALQPGMMRLRNEWESMKLQQLQVLVAVVDTGGIRAASRQLNVSQAAVTKAMKSLEETAEIGRAHV